MYIDFYVKYPLFLSEFNEIYLILTYFGKILIHKLHENLSIQSQIVPCSWTDKQTEMTKLIVTIHNFANVPKTHTEKVWVKKEDMPGENRTYDCPFIMNMG
jgi:hypothetical protein